MKLFRGFTARFLIAILIKQFRHSSLEASLSLGLMSQVHSQYRYAHGPLRYVHGKHTFRGSIPCPT